MEMTHVIHSDILQ